MASFGGLVERKNHSVGVACWTLTSRLLRLPVHVLMLDETNLFILAGQDYNVLRRAHLPLTPPTPLLPALTLSAGEY